MSSYIFLLGREPDLSLAELRSLFTLTKVQGNFAYIEATDDDVNRLKNGLGGTIKIGKILQTSAKRSDLKTFFVGDLADKVQPGKKLRFGIDCFIPELQKLTFQIKDALKKTGHSLRVIQHDNGRVKTATTLHEKLITDGIEYMLLASSDGYAIAQTVWVQDIDAYTKRDIERSRSMVVGMMPPKLAQIMINLASRGDHALCIWDPFCGLGTTLIEALNAGYQTIIGSDINEEMVGVTKENIGTNIQAKSDFFKLDATQIDTYKLGIPTVIVTEGTLGHNFAPSTLTIPSAEKEKKILTDLYKRFLASASHNPSVRRMVFCLPFWNTSQGPIYMPRIEELAAGWQVDPICQKNTRYISHMRPDQSVGREIVVVFR